MAILTKDEIIALDDRGAVEFSPESWPDDKTILLRPMPIRLFEALIAKKGEDEFISNYEFMASSIVDQDGTPLFTIDEAQKFFGDKSMVAQNSIIKKILEINGMKKEVAADVAKKSVETPTSGSSEG
jgi:hypothetical protein